MLDTNRQPLDLTDELVEAMKPSVLRGAAHVAFERFRNADEERLAELFAYLDSVPSLVRQAAAGLSLSRPDQPVAH